MFKCREETKSKVMQYSEVVDATLAAPFLLCVITGLSFATKQIADQLDANTQKASDLKDSIKDHLSAVIYFSAFMCTGYAMGKLYYAGAKAWKHLSREQRIGTAISLVTGMTVMGSIVFQASDKKYRGENILGVGFGAARATAMQKFAASWLGIFSKSKENAERQHLMSDSQVAPRIEG